MLRKDRYFGENEREYLLYVLCQLYDTLCLIKKLGNPSSMGDHVDEYGHLVVALVKSATDQLIALDAVAPCDS